MNNPRFKSFFVFFILICLMSVFVNNVGAQEVAAGDPVVLAQTGDVISFTQFVGEDIFLNGPFDAENIYFSIPPNWQMLPDSSITISATVVFNNNAPAGTEVVQSAAGSVRLFLNNNLIGLISIDKAGDGVYQFQIPPEAFVTNARPDGLYQLRFLLESGWTCNFDENMSFIISTASNLILPHDSVTPDTSLLNFPFPLYQDSSLFISSALIVIPDSPTSAELQSAMTLAAGLGNISSGNLLLDINTVGRLTQEQIASNHLILVGRAASVPFSNLIIFPIQPQNGQFPNSGGNPDDGIIQMINSPWQEDKVVLAVSGNTDNGIIKAAQAVTTGSLRTNLFPNVAIVDSVQADSLPFSSRVDQTLDEMGYGGEEMTSLGVNNSEYIFYVPPGQTISDDAFFELQYGHSSLIEYERSGLVVSVNGQPIGSVSMTAETAKEAINKVRFEIPPATIITGRNYLEVRASLIPLDRCISPDFDGLYTNIWKDSFFHLPLVTAVFNPTAQYDLAAYPAPLGINPTLGDTAFVLPKDDIEAWRQVLQVSKFLGDKSNGPIVDLAVFYADSIPVDERPNYHFIMVGQPDQLPVLQEVNNVLPAPIEFSDGVAIEPDMQVNFRINPNATLGYIEMFQSPWNADNIVLLAMGNDPQGVIWAASYLIEPLSYELRGNFAVINDTQVYTADTRISVITPGIAQPAADSQQPALEVLPPAVVELNTVAPYRPAWLMPAIILSVILILLTIFAAIYINWIRNRSVSVNKATVDKKTE